MTIAKHVFKNSVAVFARVVHHEFIHVYQRAVLGMSGNLSIYEVREFLAYHDSLFNKNYLMLHSVQWKDIGIKQKDSMNI